MILENLGFARINISALKKKKSETSFEVKNNAEVNVVLCNVFYGYSV